MSICDFIKRLTKTGWKAGYGYIINCILFSVVFYWMLGTNYYLVKKETCVEIHDSKQAVLIEKFFTKDVCNDGINTAYLLQQDPVKESKNNYLSLWAAVLAVIFVVFSIFGVLKLELTKDAIDKKFEEMKSISSFNKAQKAYHNFLTIVYQSQNDHDDIIRKSRLETIETILTQYEENIGVDEYDSMSDLYFNLIEIKKTSDEELLYRSRIIIERIGNITKEKTPKQLNLLGRCYYYKYRYTPTHNIEDLRQSIYAYCILCNQIEIAKFFEFDYDQINGKKIGDKDKRYYKFELCEVLYEYPVINGDSSGREFALKSAADIIEELINNYQDNSYEC